MNAEGFIEAVTRAIPSMDELAAHGLNADEVSEVLQTFSIGSRQLTLGLPPSSNELERLILLHDCSKLEVGLLRFLDKPRSIMHGTMVAYCEADHIVVRPDGSIAMFDHGGDNVVQCAADSEHFLSALAAFVQIRKNKKQWNGRASEAVAQCANLAGGEEYENFFNLLCAFLGSA